MIERASDTPWLPTATTPGRSPEEQARAEEATRTFGMHWADDYALYHAVLDEARELLYHVPGMTDQTLGRNIRDTVARWCLYPDGRPAGVSPAVLDMMRREVDFLLVSELDVAEDVRYELGVEE